jgi:hypothetical protein
MLRNVGWLLNSLHGVISQRIELFIISAVATFNVNSDPDFRLSPVNRFGGEMWTYRTTHRSTERVRGGGGGEKTGAHRRMLTNH